MMKIKKWEKKWYLIYLVPILVLAASCVGSAFLFVSKIGNITETKTISVQKTNQLNSILQVDRIKKGQAEIQIEGQEREWVTKNTELYVQNYRGDILVTNISSKGLTAKINITNNVDYTLQLFGAVFLLVVGTVGTLTLFISTFDFLKRKKNNPNHLTGPFYDTYQKLEDIDDPIKNKIIEKILYLQQGYNELEYKTKVETKTVTEKTLSKIEEEIAKIKEKIAIKEEKILSETCKDFNTKYASFAEKI